MEKQVHYKCTLHRDSRGQGRYREIEVVEHTDHFELLIFEGELLRSGQSTSAQPYVKSVSFPPTRDAARAAAGEETRKSVAAGWILVQSVER